MRRSVVKAKLARNELVLVTSLHVLDASVFELTSLMGFDAIWADLEHHTTSAETAAALFRAARVGRSDVVARPAKGEFARISRLLEAGASGIIYPRCDNAAEAAEVVRWAKFAPLGRRGVDGANPDMPYLTMPLGEYVRMANEQTFIAIQIEDEDALKHACEIASVPGVDLIFFGPGDYSVLSGFPGKFGHPAIQKALEKVSEAARRAGKHWGTPGLSRENTRKLLGMGARFISYMADIVLIKEGLERVQSDFAPLGFAFDSCLDQPAS